VKLDNFEREQLKEELLIHFYKEGPDHSYRIYKKIKSAVTYSSVRTALKTLENEGLIRSVKEGRQINFELTDKGKQVVEKLIGGGKQ